MVQQQIIGLKHLAHIWNYASAIDDDDIILYAAAGVLIVVGIVIGYVIAIKIRLWLL